MRKSPAARTQARLISCSLAPRREPSESNIIDIKFRESIVSDIINKIEELIFDMEAERSAPP
jgi:hypothetical protein